MCEVKILMSPDFQKLAQFTNIYPIGHSEIFRVPREEDVVVTDPPNSRKGLLLCQCADSTLCVTISKLFCAF